MPNGLKEEGGHGNRLFVGNDSPSAHPPPDAGTYSGECPQFPTLLARAPSASMKANLNSRRLPPLSSPANLQSAEPTASQSRKSCFDSAPKECLQLILGELDGSSLNNAALVNLTLRDAVRQKKTSLQLPGRDLANNLEKFPNILKIKILDKHPNQISDADVQKISGVKEQVQELNLSWYVQSVPNSDPERSFSFSSRDWLEYPLTNEGTMDLIQKFPNLSSLNLCGRYKLTDDHIWTLVNTCPKLIFLDLSRGPKVTIDTIKAIETLRPELKIISLSARPLPNPRLDFSAYISAPRGEEDLRRLGESMQRFSEALTIARG